MLSLVTSKGSSKVSEKVSPIPLAEKLPPRAAYRRLQEHDALRAELCRAVRRTCPGWLAADADDLIQEAMLRIWRLQADAGHQRTLTYAYLKQTAVSVLIDEIRRRKRRRETNATDLGLELEEQAAFTGSVHSTTIAAAIQRCLHRQGSDRQRALTLHLLGHTVKESAKLIGDKAKNIENRVYRGLKHLRDCLKEQGLEP